MNRFRSVSGLILFILLLGLPAHAYGDPSGGTLFQILMPMLVAIWTTWMIFANRIRRTIGGLLRKLRGAEDEQPTA